MPAGSPTPTSEFYGPETTPAAPAPSSPQETLPAPPKLELHGPLSATQIPSAEFQFGAAGRNEQVRALVADGRLRRLPIVVSAADPKAAASTPAKPSIFPGPVKEPAVASPIAEEAVRTAERETPASSK
jgi:hypothetical protein